MGSDFLLFFVIVLMFFGLWLYSGGPTKPISFAGPYITPVTNVGVTQSGYGTFNPSLGGSVHISSPSSIQHALENAYETLGDLQDEAAKVQLYGEPSPYKDMVSISRGSSSGKIGSEYVNLSVSHSADQNIDITGWKLVSAATGNTATIRSGVEIPQTGSVNQTGDIILHPGDRAVLASKDSPIGYSFRENECTGYLNQYQDISPALPNECPDPLDEFNKHYAGNKLNADSCYDLLRSTPTCQTPDDDSDRLSSDCYHVIDTYLTYNGCVANHRYDPDFAGNEWHIYFGLDKDDDDALWKQSREAIKLVDQDGKTVDVVEY